MAKISSILGLNARNHLFQSKYNFPSGKEIVDSKLETKKFLKKHKIPAPVLYGVFKQFKDVPEFDWGSCDKDFVIKPTSGFGGKGIIVIKKRISSDEFMTINKEKINIDDLKLQILDILEGKFSHRSQEGEAIIEERIPIHPSLMRYTYQGTPDIRVLALNAVPVMAMLRLATAESEGKANLHQGAIGAGIDLSTGKTTHGVLYDKPIKIIPGKNLRIVGKQIPFWNEILEISVKAQKRIKNLGYLAVDFVIDKERGPLVLELTARPGLAIQTANMVGLKRRLERVEGLDIETEEKAIRIAKDLFGRRPRSKKRNELDVFEIVKVSGKKGSKLEIEAKVDTGAFRSSIDRTLARKLGLLEKKNILFKTNYESALGQQERQVIGITMWLGGKRLKTTASVADRSNVRKKMIIGRRDLKGYIIKP